MRFSHRRDKTIEDKIDRIVRPEARRQAPDGYMNFWYLGREPQNRWTNLRDNHELYMRRPYAGGRHRLFPGNR